MSESNAPQTPPGANSPNQVYVISPEEKIYPNSTKDIPDATGPIAPYGTLRKGVDQQAPFNKSNESTVNVQSFSGTKASESSQTAETESPILPKPTQAPDTVLQLDPQLLTLITNLPNLMNITSGISPSNQGNSHKRGERDPFLLFDLRDGK